MSSQHAVVFSYFPGSGTPPAGTAVPNIFYRSQSSVSYANHSGGTTLSAPVGILDGDILLVTFFSGSGLGSAPSPPTAPAGFTQFGTETSVVNGGFYGSLSIWWKRASSESGSYQFTHNTAYSTEAVMKVFGGCLASGTPMSATSNNTGTGLTATGTGITTTAANSMLLWEAHNWSAVGAYPPGGMVRLFSHLVDNAFEFRATAGATGNRTQTLNQAGGDAWASRMVELLSDTATLYTGNIAFRSSSTTTYASRTNTTMTPPAGLADNDIMVATLVEFHSATPPAVTPPAGWTLFGTSTRVADGGSIVDFHVYWKRAASESGNYTWTHAAVNTQCLIKAYSGCKTSGTPLGATVNNTGTGPFATGLSLTTTAANSYLLFEAHDFSGTNNATTPSPGMTERFDSLINSADQPLTLVSGRGTGERPMINNNLLTGTPAWAVRMVELLPDTFTFGDILQTSTGTSTSATTTPTLPLPTRAGSLLVLTFGSDAYNATVNSGWTESSEMEQQAFHGGYLWWMKCSGSDTIPPYTIGSAVNSSWVLTEYCGPFDASPYDGSQGVFSNSTGINNISTDSLTPTSGSRLLVAAFAASDSVDTSAWGDYTYGFAETAQIANSGSGTRERVAQTRRILTANGSTAYSTAGVMAAGTAARTALIIAFKAA